MSIFAARPPRHVSRMERMTYCGTVYPWQCDHMGHMNVMFYVGKFDEASWMFLASLGLTPDYLRRSNRGVVAVEQRLAYKRELLAGDTVVVRSRILDVRDKSLQFVHEMTNAQSHELAATSHFTAVHIDRSARRACAFEPDVLAAIRGALAA
jgi:acyl-CoA thioester hydrolase